MGIKAARAAVARLEKKTQLRAILQQLEAKGFTAADLYAVGFMQTLTGSALQTSRNTNCEIDAKGYLECLLDDGDLGIEDDIMEAFDALYPEMRS